MEETRQTSSWRHLAWLPGQSMSATERVGLFMDSAPVLPDEASRADLEATLETTDGARTWAGE